MRFIQSILTLLTVSLFLICSLGQDVKECPTSECGAPLLMLNYLCPDGLTTAGPSGRCLDTGSGCRWEVITCPETECASDSDCTSPNEKRFCQKSSCSDEKGKCASTGTGMCTMIYAPVCGCDGKTYASRCVATAAGANIQHAGACDGSECSFDGACKNGSFCERPNCTATVGICQPRPEACMEIYDPVCGCDGKTHGNKCSANSAGVNVQYPGECAKQNETVGRCTESSQCPKGLFCSKRSCDAEYGVCAQSEGLSCTKIYDPVCGCDGQTYGSACTAQQNAQNVAYAGECKTDPSPFGTKCSQSSDCDEGSFCSKESCDAESGECVNPAAVLCPAIYDPVCGCDGKTYGSSCDALLNRTNVKYKGECDECDGCTPIYLFVPCADGSRGYKCVLNGTSQCVTQLTNCPVAVPTRANCSSNDDCLDGSFCSKPTCTSESGQCVQSEGIACIAIYDPVCGCDGKTYGSACTARTFEQNVDYAGECNNTEEAPEGEKCSADSECGEGSFCQKRSCNSRSGKCTQYGLYLCPYIYDPVCGCDGVTYPSSCQAINMGKNIRHKGECRKRRTPTTANNGKRCIRDNQCGPNSICQKETCQSLTGKCQRYDTIKCSTIHDPVCGCDGNTYSNACLALVAGQNVDPNGTCQKTKRNLMKNQNNQKIHKIQRRNLKRK